jgi:predicted PurR-regulated permease PerM
LSTNIEFSLTQLLPQASALSGNVFNFTVSIFANLATFFTMLVISIYLSLDWPNIKRRFISLLPIRVQDEVKETISDVEQSVGHWLKGQSFLMCVVGSMSFVGLVALDVTYPLAIALISGILEAVPMIGPLISAIVAAIIGFSISPSKGFAVIALYIVIQQVENNFIVPKVMGKVSGFSPLVILLALLIGTNFFGFVGAILAVPSTIITVVIIKHILRYTAAQQ